jgi:hypothetical protein
MFTKHLVRAALTGIALLPLAASAQQQVPAPKQQLIAVDEQRMDALRRGDPLPLEKIYADGFVPSVVIATLAQCQPQTARGHARSWRNTLRASFATYRRMVLSIQT